LNGSFESPVRHGGLDDGMPYYYYVRAAPLADWRIVGPCLDILDSRPPYWVAADGEQFVEPESGFGVAIEQTLATIPGAQYRIRFAYAPNPIAAGTDDLLNVYWDGTLATRVDEASTDMTRLAWTYVECVVQARGRETVIRFEDGFAGVFYTGPYLDDVSVTPLEVAGWGRTQPPRAAAAAP